MAPLGRRFRHSRCPRGNRRRNAKRCRTRPPIPTNADREPFGYCFNTSTIRGQKLDLPAQIDVAADAGYSAVELWVGDVEAFVRKGGSLRDLAHRIRDLGLTVPSTISFFSWLCDDAARRAKGLEQAKREMDLVRQLGAMRIAAPARRGDRKPARPVGSGPPLPGAAGLGLFAGRGAAA